MSNIFKRAAQAAAATAVLAFATQASAAGIRLVSATYGGPGGAVCNATPAVASACNGTASCMVGVMNYSLCGDPDFLVVKQISVAYKCGRHHAVHTVAGGEYTALPLACP